MTRDEIRALEDVELALAVIAVLPDKKPGSYDGTWWWHHYLHTSPGTHYVDRPPYRPDRNISEAWELVEERNFTVAPTMPIGAQFNACRGRTGWAVYDCGSTPLAFANLPSTAALCVAICRAYLLAKAAEEDEQLRWADEHRGTY